MLMPSSPSKRDKIYQDRYIRGQVVTAGTRECLDRYTAIAEALGEREQPFSLLDIGANQGYFSFRLAAERGALCVMVEKQDDLLRNCLADGGNNLILLKHRITTRELVWLSREEHFDVALCLNVIHHFGWRWRRATRAIFDLANDVFIENPPDEDTGSRGRLVRRPINRYLDSLPHEVICQSDRRRDRPISSAIRRYASPAVDADRQHSRIRGIGLATFARLGGSYPDRGKISQLVDELQSSIDHPLAIEDIVLCGNSVELRRGCSSNDADGRAGVGALRAFLAKS